MRHAFAPWRHVNKRGKILLIYGLIWVAIGFNVYAQPVAPGQEHLLFTSIPVSVRAGAWIVTGLVAVVTGLVPRWAKFDRFAFFALYLMPAERVAIFLLGWVDHYVPGLDVVGWFELFGTDGYARGLYAALIWLIIVAAVVVLSDWPDPPLREDRT